MNKKEKAKEEYLKNSEKQFSKSIAMITENNMDAAISLLQQIEHDGDKYQLQLYVTRAEKTFKKDHDEMMLMKYPDEGDDFEMIEAKGDRLLN